ncbi:asparaginase [Thalassolituus sp. LLYu03]|uniref:asparaginase n=1 Tax=Thalassolituus sp. LLYu03 TaxID=3421656 RepID=UPI003D27E190
MTEQRKHIYIAYTGGTIGMAKTAQGYQPVAGFLEQKLRSLPEFTRADMPQFTVHEYQPLLDSSDMTPAHWQMIAADILANYSRYDGFVVLHGTDTMAYTASALSFMLPDLGKPVIVTGSQIPLAEMRSDGHDNLLNALYIAANYPLAEVGLFFHHQLLRGNRASKTDAKGFNAFTSPNCEPLLNVGIDVQPRLPPLRPLHPNTPSFQPVSPKAIAVLTLYPGLDFSLAEHWLAQPLDGLILQTFGAGNAPQQPQLLNALKAAHQRGVVLVNHTQCARGGVNMGGYAGGHALRDCGLVSAGDMTLEATLTKLHVLLSRTGAPAQIIASTRTLMEKSLCGELTATE